MGPHGEGALEAPPGLPQTHPMHPFPLWVLVCPSLLCQTRAMSSGTPREPPDPAVGVGTRKQSGK